MAAAAAKPAKAAAARRPAAAKAQPAAKAKAATPKAPALNAPKKVVPQDSADGLPRRGDRALPATKVVVVSLVVPGSAIDELAAGEAKAGAKLGGAGYLALNVLNEHVAHVLLARAGRAEGAERARVQALG